MQEHDDNEGGKEDKEEEEEEEEEEEQQQQEKRTRTGVNIPISVDPVPPDHTQHQRQQKQQKDSVGQQKEEQRIITNIQESGAGSKRKNSVLPTSSKAIPLDTQAYSLEDKHGAHTRRYDRKRQNRNIQKYNKKTTDLFFDAIRSETLPSSVPIISTPQENLSTQQYE